VYWIEEPTRHDDYAGRAQIAAALKTPVGLVQNWGSSGNCGWRA